MKNDNEIFHRKDDVKSILRVGFVVLTIYAITVAYGVISNL